MEQDTNLEDQASRKEVVVRKKKDTAKGLQHKKELSEKRFNKSKRKLVNQLTVLNKIVEQWSDQSEEVANSARFKLESLHSEFMENLLKQRELVQEDTQTYAELNEMANQFDEMVFDVGNKVSQLQRQSMTSDHHVSVSQVSSKFSRSSLKIKAKLAGLEAERHALLANQQQEVEAEKLSAEQNNLISLEIVKAKQQADLLKKEEEIAKVRAVEQVYRVEEQKKQQICTSSVVGSVISNVSRSSSIAKKAELAGLEAELEAKKITQQAELHLAQLQAMSEAGINKKSQDTARKMKLLDLEKEIAKSKAVTSTLDGSPLANPAHSHHGFFTKDLNINVSLPQNVLPLSSGSPETVSEEIVKAQLFQQEKSLMEEIIAKKKEIEDTILRIQSGTSYNTKKTVKCQRANKRLDNGDPPNSSSEAQVVKKNTESVVSGGNVDLYKLRSVGPGFSMNIQKATKMRPEQPQVKEVVRSHLLAEDNKQDVENKDGNNRVTLLTSDSYGASQFVSEQYTEEQESESLTLRRQAVLEKKLELLEKKLSEQSIKHQEQIKQKQDEIDNLVVNSSQVSDNAKETQQISEDNISCSKELISQISTMFKLSSVPVVELDTFSGDILEYTYFITNFREVVEKAIVSQTSRLNLLLKHTSGKAKDLVKNCTLESQENCYDKAIALLNKEYGNPHKISCAYLEQLDKWPSVKLSDVDAFRRFHLFLSRCFLVQQNGGLEILNSPMTIKTLQLKLPTSHQDKWSNKVQKIRRELSREPLFEDFVLFIEFESSVLADPFF